MSAFSNDSASTGRTAPVAPASGPAAAGVEDVSTAAASVLAAAAATTAGDGSSAAASAPAEPGATSAGDGSSFTNAVASKENDKAVDTNSINVSTLEVALPEDEREKVGFKEVETSRTVEEAAPVETLQDEAGAAKVMNNTLSPFDEDSEDEKSADKPTAGSSNDARGRREQLLLQLKCEFSFQCPVLYPNTN